MAALTQARLKELLNYDPETGVFTRKVRTANRIHEGDVAGGINNYGYIRIRLDGKYHKAHRLAWLWITGAWPTHQIDHINLDKSDNRIANLREATNTQNKGNALKHVSNTSGFKGVSWNRKDRKWIAQIGANYRSVRLGSFDTIEEARAAYAKAAIVHFGEFARPE